MSATHPFHPLISRAFHVVILVAALTLGLYSGTCHAQAAGNIMVVEKHIGGSTVYSLRNGGQVDAMVTVSFTNLSDGQRASSQIPVAAQAFSRDVATSDTSTKPVIMSVQFSLPPSSALQPALTP